MKSIVGTFLVLLLITSVHAGGMELITKEQYGDKWPFTIESGHLECQTNAVILHTDKGIYNVNGKAMSRFADKFKSIKEILKPHPIPMVAQAGGFFPISDTDIIQRGLKLCQ